ncbi:transcriptional regulator [Selenomonas sp. oral taxon 126]|uniref:sigma factor-like helix-turn-helix DNA-binding protein n=1 Tax=Selenomonas sp. oral taxon 126 TaxID=712528 RepID=UPI0008079970|nr:sigma factor-like helix-turn-helix DNA-binding protein [Selenomonas sp. oral taxon 126]ANR71908.1 transcriptional regulator [Selenomonas sp. oral taxon 126]
MERLYELARLYDLYGGLLREKQRECLRLHIAEDFSLAEIGGELGITRQAAHDNIRRAERALAEMEEALGLCARQEAQERALAAICAELNALEEPITCAQVRAIAEKFEPYMEIDGKEAGE